MTILPKNFGGAKKSHRKPTNSQAEHVPHQKGQPKKPVVERAVHQQRHLVQTPQSQEPLNSDDEYESGFKDDEVKTNL